MFAAIPSGERGIRNRPEGVDPQTVSRRRTSTTLPNFSRSMLWRRSFASIPIAIRALPFLLSGCKYRKPFYFFLKGKIEFFT